jgi:hypothetical protein
VGVEDRRFGLADLARGAGADTLHVSANGGEGFLEPPPLDRRVVGDGPGEVDRSCVHRPRGADADAG